MSEELIESARSAEAARFIFSAVGIRDALRCYRRRVVAVFAAAVAVGLALIVITSPVYDSSALLLVKFGQQQVYRPPLNADAAPIAPAGSQIADDMVSTQVQILRSRDIIEPVIQKIGVAVLYPELVDANYPIHSSGTGPVGQAIVQARSFYRKTVTPYFEWLSHGSVLDRAVLKFQRDLSIQQARASLLLQVTYRNRIPTVARLALETLLQEHRRVSAALDGGEEATFYSSALAHTEKQLSDAEAELNQFRSKSGVIAFKEQLPMMLEQRQKLADQLVSVSVSLAGVESRNAKLHEQLASLPDTVTAYSETRFASNQVGVTRTARNPLRGDVENAIQQGEAEHAALRGRIAAITQQLGTADIQIHRASYLDGVRTVLETNVAAVKDSFRNLKARAQEAALLVDLSQRQSSTLLVAQQPTLPDVSDPAAPAPMRYMLIATAVGALGGLTVAVASMMFAPRSTRRRSSEFADAAAPRSGHLPGTTGYHG